MPIPGRELHEYCGVFGVHQVENAASLTYYGLHSLQHRGQESAGICSSDGEYLTTVKGAGLVTEVFDELNWIRWSRRCRRLAMYAIVPRVAILWRISSP